MFLLTRVQNVISSIVPVFLLFKKIKYGSYFKTITDICAHQNSYCNNYYSLMVCIHNFCTYIAYIVFLLTKSCFSRFTLFNDYKHFNNVNEITRNYLKNPEIVLFLDNYLKYSIALNNDENVKRKFDEVVYFDSSLTYYPTKVSSLQRMFLIYKLYQTGMF